MIRPARHSDVPAMVELGRLLHDESPIYAGLPFAPAAVAAIAGDLIEDPDGFAWIAERDGELVGFLAGFVTQHWCLDARFAHELSLFVRRDARGALFASRLIREFTAWARGRGAVRVRGGASTGLNDERTAALYERLGFKRMWIGLEAQ